MLAPCNVVEEACLSTTRSAAAWRRELGGDQTKRTPCDTCSAGMLSTPEETKVIVDAHRQYASAG